MSLPEAPQNGHASSSNNNSSDLYRLREFTVSNKRIISHTESLQPRYVRSNNSINSSASRFVFDLVTFHLAFKKASHASSNLGFYRLKH